MFTLRQSTHLQLKGFYAERVFLAGQIGPESISFAVQTFAEVVLSGFLTSFLSPEHVASLRPRTAPLKPKTRLEWATRPYA
jgi:hypothetical protein